MRETAIKTAGGGVNVPHRKNTKNLSCVRIPVPETVVIPMQQSIGAPCVPLVKVGDRVLVGQKIGDSDKFVSAPIHASVSGTVKAITDIRLANGSLSTAVTIASDGLMEVSEEVKPPKVENLADLLKAVRESGIVGLGGAGFPTYGKLSDKADTIILNCAECEPLLKLHRQLLKAHVREVLKAFALIAETVGAKEAIIGIKEEYESTIEALEEYIGEYPMMRIHKLPGAYPMGDEVVLIYEATGRVVRPGGLPIECGVAVFNVETVHNVYRAVWENKPVTEKYVTVVGEVEQPITVRVPIGTRIRDVVAMAGKITTQKPVYLLGGPMMGSFGSDYQPVTKTTNAIIVLPEDHTLVYRKTNRFSTAVARAASSCCRPTWCRSCRRGKYLPYSYQGR